MAKFDKNALTPKQLEKAMDCKTAKELMTTAKAEGIELTRDEAEAYMAELAELELSANELKEITEGFACNRKQICYDNADGK